MRNHQRFLAALAACVVLLGVVSLSAAASSGEGGSSSTNPSAILSAVRDHAMNLAEQLGIGEDESQVAPGTLDDGRDLLPQAKISIDQAIEAAKSAQTGTIGEVDLEHYNGRLVFNVDVGNSDVKVDAETGAVLASESDD